MSIKEYYRQTCLCIFLCRENVAVGFVEIDRFVKFKISESTTLPIICWVNRGFLPVRIIQTQTSKREKNV